MEENGEKQNNLPKDLESSSKASFKSQLLSTNDGVDKAPEGEPSSGHMEPHQGMHSEREASSLSSSSSPSSRKDRGKHFSVLVKEGLKRMRLRGIEEIDESHWLYPMATAIRTGLQESQKAYHPPVDIVSRPTGIHSGGIGTIECKCRMICIDLFHPDHHSSVKNIKTCML